MSKCKPKCPSASQNIQARAKHQSVSQNARQVEILSPDPLIHLLKAEPSNCNPKTNQTTKIFLFPNFRFWVFNFKTEFPPNQWSEKFEKSIKSYLLVIETYGKTFMAGFIPAQNLLNIHNFLKKKTEKLFSSA